VKAACDRDALTAASRAAGRGGQSVTERQISSSRSRALDRL